MREEGSDWVWDEYDWERFLQQQDRKTAHYLKLLEQYLDHPQRDQIIAREMGWSHLLENDGRDWAANLEQLFAQEDRVHALQDLSDDDDEDEDDDDDEDEDDDDDEFEDEAAVEEDDDEEAEEGVLIGDGDDDADEDDEEDETVEGDEEEWEDEEEDFESHPVYLTAMALTSWIDEAIQEHEALGREPLVVRMATHAAICASKLAAALTDGGIDELGMTIAYLKRAVAAINTVLESFLKLQNAELLPPESLDRIRYGVFETRNGIVDLMGQFRAEWRKRYGTH